MTRRNPLVPALLAVAIGACADADRSPTGPSTEPGAAVAAAAVSNYTIKNLGTLGGIQSRANAINNLGETVGWSNTSAGLVHAFIYRAGVMRDLGALAGGLSEATGINDSSVVVGYSTLLSGAMRAVRWKDGVKKNLGTLGGRNSMAMGINEAGVIVGWSETASGNRHAFVWKNGVMTDIGTLGGGRSQANAINKAGRVVGSSTTASGRDHAFAWNNGVFKDLGDNGWEFGVATAINSGRIVGYFGPPPDAVGGEREMITPFVFDGGVTKTFFTREQTSTARGVNADGIIVGGDEDVRSDFPVADAWVRQSDGTLEYLPELADDISAAQGINKFGTIVGFSTPADGWPKAVLWRHK